MTPSHSYKYITFHWTVCVLSLLETAHLISYIAYIGTHLCSRSNDNDIKGYKK